mmetsp:Transcript_21126/g.29382  ORF Transcript_21126/g.29382 Transcript_21126/m.29382 type:complete len:97 (-) Transcript_21126:248-538(-)
MGQNIQYFFLQSDDHRNEKTQNVTQQNVAHANVRKLHSMHVKTQSVTENGMQLNVGHRNDRSCTVMHDGIKYATENRMQCKRMWNTETTDHTECNA